MAVADELRAITDDAGFVAAVTDESGTILWTCGGREMLRRAGAVNFAPGGRWGEEAMGTNALSLALRNGTASTVFSAEHLVHALHGWVCYCTPLHGPDGTVLGVLDLSSTWDRSHPLAMPALRTLAGAGISDARLMFTYQKAHAPLRRTVTIEEIGGSALYLLSHLSNGVTGEIHYVDSGYNIISMPRPDVLKAQEVAGVTGEEA